MMPIAIHSNLPHIVMQFRTNLDCPHCPLICCAIDLCAALTTGNFHFFALLVKCFPHCLAKVYAPQDYTPIILSRVMQSHQQEAVTTKLEVGIPVSHPLQDYRMGRFILDDSDRSPCLHQYHPWSAFHARYGDDPRPRQQPG